MPSNPGTELFTCTVHKRLTGLEFRLKSAQIEEAMRLVSNNRTSREQNGAVWDGNSYYVLEMGANGLPLAFPGFSSGRFDMWGAKELLLAPREPRFNLSMLRAVGLGSETGVTIRVTTVMSDKQLSDYIEGLKAGVRQFYIDFLKESTRTIRITTEEIIS